MTKEKMLQDIVSKELKMFKTTKSIGGPASCQSQDGNFILARISQWRIYNDEILNSYLEDLNEAIESNRNLVTEKYAYMMEETFPDEFEKIKNKLPLISENKLKLVKSIILFFLFWEEDVKKNNSYLITKTRPLYSSENTKSRISIETYLRGELKTYSERTLQLILNYSLEKQKLGENLVYENLKYLHDNSKIKNACNCNNENVKENIKEEEKIMTNMSTNLAEKIKEFAFEKARELNVPIVISVVDSGANICLIERMDDALLASISISQSKAITALSLKKSTEELAKIESLKNINNYDSSLGKLLFLGGGQPIYIANKLVGALGVSGGSVEEDVTIANYALEKIRNSF